MYKKNGSSCLHVRGGFLIHIKVRIGLSNPTILLFKHGEVVERKIGVLPYKDLEAWVLQQV